MWFQYFFSIFASFCFKHLLQASFFLNDFGAAKELREPSPSASGALWLYPNEVLKGNKSFMPLPVHDYEMLVCYSFLCFFCSFLLIHFLLLRLK